MTNIEYYESKNLLDRIDFSESTLGKLRCFVVYYLPKHNKESKIELFRQYYDSVVSLKSLYSVSWLLKDKDDEEFISIVDPGLVEEWS